MTADLKFTAPLPWQLTQWDYLLQRRAKNNLPHALLLQGISGLGKKRFAIEFAKTLFCLQKDNQICGYCSACQLIKSNSHPDFYHLQPEEAGKAIRIDPVRELIAQFSQTSQQGGYKIALIEPADALNPAAANALLKTLEEPTPNTLLVLITDQPSFLSATIRSRCQGVSFLPPAHEVAETWLNKYASNTDWSLLLALAEGAPLNALAFSEPEFMKQRMAFFKDFTLLSLEKSNSPVAMAGKWFKSDIRQVISWLKAAVIDMIRLQTGALQQVANRDLISTLETIGQKIHSQRLYSYLDKLYKVSQELNKVSLQQQLVLEDLFCSWSACFR